MVVNNAFTSENLSCMLKYEKNWGVLGTLDTKKLPKELEIPYIIFEN